jgi:hypothetical protein
MCCSGHFVYRQQQAEHVQRGFLGLACERYERAVIKKHAANESAGTVTLRTLNCNLSAVVIEFRCAENPYLANYIAEKTPPDREAPMSTAASVLDHR